MKTVTSRPQARRQRLLVAGLMGLFATSLLPGQTGESEVIRALREEVAALRKQLAATPAPAAAPAPAATPAPAPAAVTAPEPASATTGTNADGEEVLTLSSFVVKSEKDYGYLKTNAATATKIGMEIQKVPMNISVVSEEFLDDTNARSLTDLFRYSAAASGDNRFAMRVPANEATPQGGFTMRGFTVNTLMRNGVFRYISHNFDNVERVEVVKGPAAVFFGQGYPGGVVNFVTKRPSLTTIPNSLTYQVLDNSGQRASFDVNTVLDNKKAAFRVVGAWEDAGGERTYEFTRGMSVSPSLLFVPFASGKVRINLEAEFSDKKFHVNDYDWIFSDFAGWKDAATNGTYGSSTAKLSNTITANAANGLGANVVQATTTPTLAYATYINNKRTATGDLYLPAYTSVERGGYYTDASGNRVHDEGFDWTSRGAYSREQDKIFSVTVDASPFRWLDARYSFTHDEAKHSNVGAGPVLSPYADGIHYNIAVGGTSTYNRFTDTHTADLVFKKDSFLGGDHKLLAGISYADWVQQYGANAATSDYNWAFLPGARNKTSNPDYNGLNVSKYDIGAVPVNQVIYDRYGAIKPVRQLYSNFDPGYEISPDINTYWKDVQRNTIDAYKPKLYGQYLNYQGSFIDNRLTVLTGYRQEKRWERGQFAIVNYPWFSYGEEINADPDSFPTDVWGHSPAYMKTNVIDTKGDSWMGGASFAINDSLNAYASVSKIFKFNTGTVGGFASGDELLYAQGLIDQYKSIGQQGFNYKGTLVTSVEQFTQILEAQNYYKIIPNEDGMNYEGGLKYSSPGGKIVGTWSVFSAERSNQKQDDTIATLNINEPLNYSADVNIIAGINRAVAAGATSPTSFSTSSSGRVFRIRNYDNTVRISGTELEVIWTPIRNFQAVINGSWLPQAELVADSRPLYAQPGTPAFEALTATQKRDATILWESRVANVPEYRANFFGKYTFADNFVGAYGRGVSVGAGVRYSSETVIAQNVDWNPLNGGYQAGDYVVFDLTLGIPYTLFGYKLNTALGVYNVTDEQYSEGSFVLSPGRNWTLTTSLKF